MSQPIRRGYGPDGARGHHSPVGGRHPSKGSVLFVHHPRREVVRLIERARRNGQPSIQLDGRRIQVDQGRRSPRGKGMTTDGTTTVGGCPRLSSPDDHPQFSFSLPVAQKPLRLAF
jgi:hypothetical protein